MATILSDEEVFETAPQKKILSEEEVLGTSASITPEATPIEGQVLSDDEVFGIAPEDDDNPLVRGIKDYWQEVKANAQEGDVVLGTGEALTAMTVNTAGAMLGGLVVMGDVITKLTGGTSIFPTVTTEDNRSIPDSMKDTFERITSTIHYDPTTDKGKQYSEVIFWPFEQLAKSREIIGEATFESVEDTGLPAEAKGALAAGVSIIPEALAYLFLPAALKVRAKSVEKVVEGKVIPEEVIKSEEIILEGDAPLPGAQYREATVDPVKLGKVEGGDAILPPEQLVDYAKGVMEGRIEPTVIVEMREGKPTKVLEGASAIAIAEAGGQKAIKVRVVERPVEKVPEVQVIADANKVQGAFDKSREAEITLRERVGKSIVSHFKTGVIDIAQEVRSRLLTQGGKEGKIAVMRHDVIMGAPAKAQQVFLTAEKEIFAGLKHKTQNVLNDVITARRIMEVDQYKGIGVVKHPEGINGAQAKRYLSKLEENIGSEAFFELQKRADKYFDITNQQLIKLHDNGVIDTALYNKLKQYDYTPTEFIAHIDPEVSFQIGKRKITVHASGIERFKGGGGGAIRMDTRELLAQVIGRTEARVLRNKANRALFEFVEEFPDNGWARVAVEGKKAKKVSPREVQIDFMMDGKRKSIFMEERLGEQWLLNDPVMSAGFSNALRLIGGGALVRPLATGFNPAFALVNMPRDIGHIWLVTSEYSRHPLWSGGQMAVDLMATAKDAFLRDGAFNDYINEGGGMNFLTHQGRDPLMTNKFSLELHPRMQKTKQALAYINETSEIWTRLMLRHRAMKNKKTPEEATYVARSYLDFSRGGNYTKAADNAIPYLNATMQAFRGVVRSAKDNPKDFAIKTAWLATTDLQIQLANYLVNPENWSQISDRTKRDNFVITTPMYTTDRDGNKRHVYFTLRKDNTTAPLMAMTQSLFSRVIEGRVPDTKVLEDIKAGTPLSGTIPSIEGWYTLAANKDFWTDEKIWKGPEDIEPSEQFKLGTEPSSGGRRTPLLWRQLGSMFNQSPEILQRSVGKVVPQNPYTGLMGLGFQYMMEGLSPAQQEQTFTELLAASPIIRRTMHLTHPASTEIERLEQRAIEPQTEEFILNRDLDDVYFKFAQGQLAGGEKTVESWLKTKGPHADRLKKRFMKHRKVDLVFKRFKEVRGVPSKFWWLESSSRSANTRAEIFYQEMIQRDAPNRQKMLTMAQALSSQGIAYTSDDFKRRLALLIKEGEGNK